MHEREPSTKLGPWMVVKKTRKAKKNKTDLDHAGRLGKGVGGHTINGAIMDDTSGKRSRFNTLKEDTFILNNDNHEDIIETEDNNRKSTCNNEKNAEEIMGNLNGVIIR